MLVFTGRVLTEEKSRDWVKLTDICSNYSFFSAYQKVVTQHCCMHKQKQVTKLFL